MVRNIPLLLGHTVQLASWGPETLQSPAAAPGSPPRSLSQPQCVSADCGDSRPESAGMSEPELWSCSRCGQPEEEKFKVQMVSKYFAIFIINKTAFNLILL